jgi:hypothetical protein
MLAHVVYDFVGHHSSRTIASSKRRPASRIAFIVVPTLPAYAAIALANGAIASPSPVGLQLVVIVSALLAAAMHVVIAAAWMHSDELDQEGWRGLLQSVPRPSWFRNVYRSTPSMLVRTATSCVTVLG